MTNDRHTYAYIRYVFFVFIQKAMALTMDNPMGPSPGAQLRKTVHDLKGRNMMHYLQF